MLSSFQLNGIYDVVSDIISNLDETAVNQLMSGSMSDINGMLDVFFDEAYLAMFTAGGHTIRESSFDYLEKVADQFEESLRLISMNYFVSSVLPKFELAPHIMEWDNLIQIYQRLCVIAARGHAKSHTFSFAQILWKLYRYRNNFAGSRRVELQMCREGMLITNEFSLAEHLLSMVKEEIEENDILSAALRPIGKKPNDWGSTYLKAKNGASIVAKSYGSKIRGWHPTYINMDDFLNESVLYSVEQKDKYNKFFDAVITNTLIKTGQITVVGTPFVDGDLYDHIKSLKGWAYFEYPAIFPNGEVLWESEHNYHSLMDLMARIGHVNFSREILVRKINEHSSVFPYDLIKLAYRNMETVVLVDSLKYHKERSKFKYIVTGCDFAMSSSVSADYTAFYTLGVDEYDRAVLLNAFRAKGLPYDQQVSIAVGIYQNFDSDLFVVETNGAQVIFAQMMEDRGLPVMEHHTGVEKNSLSEGVPALAISFAQEKALLPRGDEKSRQITDILSSQLTSFTYDPSKGKLMFVIDHDDDAMAYWQAWRGVRYLLSGGVSFSFIQ